MVRTVGSAWSKVGSVYLYFTLFSLVVVSRSSTQLGYSFPRLETQLGYSVLPD